MKLIFIDDEATTRNGILNHINWKTLGITEVAAFSNPFKALAYARQEHVDIVLTDIRMPNMDGIQLCHSIVESNPSVSIIFISGYSDKEYLLSAIQLSAVDYVEKPVNIAQLECALKKAVSKRLQGSSFQNDPGITPAILQKSRQFYVDQFIADLIHGNAPVNIPDSLLTDLSGQLPVNTTDFYRVYLWKAGFNTIDLKETMQSIQLRIANAGIMPHFLMSRKDERNYLLIARFPSVFACNSQKIDLLLSDCLRLQPGESLLSCSYGYLLEGFHNICESYKQAVLASQRIFFTGYGTIMPYLENHSVYNAVPTVLSAPLNQMAEYIRKQELEACKECLEEFYHACEQRTDMLPDMIKNEYFKLLSLFSENSSSIPMTNPLDAETKYLWKHITPLETLADCHRYVLSEAEQYFSNLSDMNSDRKIILKIIHYIQVHYNDHNLCINEIAEKVHMTPNYLSTLFKKETGKTIGNYITEVRLEQSCQLLNQTDRKLCDIAQAVGYTDTNYYSKLFKKHYYLTPSEYRNKSTSK